MIFPKHLSQTFRVSKIFKIFYVAAFLSIVAFACSSDDDSGSTDDNQAKIIGTWKFTASTTNGETDTDNWICDFEETYEFSTSTITIKYYYDPSGENGSDCQLDGMHTVNYDIDGNTISGEEGDSVEIITLNNTTLILEETETYDGTTYIYTETYTKQ